jgi:hypothetical protein
MRSIALTVVFFLGLTGKYIVVWEKVGKDWKLATDTWNEGQ